jgi:hypothetical protein
MARTLKKTKAATVLVADQAETSSAPVNVEAAAIPASGKEVFIPLNKLKKSPRNARTRACPAEKAERRHEEECSCDAQQSAGRDTPGAERQQSAGEMIDSDPCQQEPCEYQGRGSNDARRVGAGW